MIMQGQIHQESFKKKNIRFQQLYSTHPPYSLELTPRHFHLFCSLQNALNNKKCSWEDQVKIFEKNLLNSKPADFYLRGINRLPDKWQEVIENNGDILFIEINSLLNYS